MLKADRVEYNRYRPAAGRHNASVVRTTAGISVVCQTKVVTHLMS